MNPLVVAPAKLPDAVRAQQPVQHFVHKLLAAISHSEQLLDEQNEALTKFRREASDAQTWRPMYSRSFLFSIGVL